MNRFYRYCEISYYELEDRKSDAYNKVAAFLHHCFLTFERSHTPMIYDNLIMMWKSDFDRLISNQKEEKR